MKKLLLFIIGCLFISALFAQEQPEKEKKPQKPQKGKMVLIGFFIDSWQAEQAGVTFKTMNRGASIYVLREKKLGEGVFGLALGIGVGSHNLYSDGFLATELDQAGMPTDNVIFSKIPDNIDYNINKFSVSYFDIPIELRFHPKGSFKIAAGFKAGVLVNSHTKYSGKDPSGNGEDIKVKYLKIKNVEPLRYGITGRIGYKDLNLTFFYSLSEIFKDKKGPELYPISFGLTIAPF